MLSNQGQAAAIVQLVNSQSAANTAAASSSATYVDVTKYEGDLVFIFNPGAITGSCTPDIQDATDTAGTGTASVVPNEGAYTALVASTARKYTIPAGSVRGFIRVINTVVTGPALIGVTMLAHPKYT
jgi:hypothetical protein